MGLNGLFKGTFKLSHTGGVPRLCPHSFVPSLKLKKKQNFGLSTQNLKFKSKIKLYLVIKFKKIQAFHPPGTPQKRLIRPRWCRSRQNRILKKFFTQFFDK